MNTIEAMDLPAAGFRYEAERLNETASKLAEEETDDWLESEIEEQMERIYELYQDATDAYRSAKVWSMQIETYEEKGRIDPKTARQEQERAASVIQDYKEGKRRIDEAAAYIDDGLEIDVWERIDPDTQLFDSKDYVEDADMDIEMGGVFRLFDAASTVYNQAEGLYGRIAW